VVAVFFSHTLPDPPPFFNSLDVYKTTTDKTLKKPGKTSKTVDETG